MKILRANIPSKKEFTVNENGEIFNYQGRKLKGKSNPNSKTLKALDFLNNDGKRQAMSYQKIVWNTFNHNNPVQEKEIIILKNQDHEYPFALSNLKKVTKSDTVKVMNEIRLTAIKNRKNS